MKYILLCWVALLGCLSSASFAVPKDAPLIAQLSGDLWSWNGSWKRLTYWEGNSSPVLSPDGSKVAYRSSAAGMPDCVGTGEDYGCIGFSFEYTNVYVFELQSGKGRRIAAQPPGQTPKRWKEIGTMRYGLVWSPDGTRLAWTEQSIGAYLKNSNNWDVVLYTVANGKTERFTVDARLDREDFGMKMYWTPRSLGLRWDLPFGAVLRWYSTVTGRVLEEARGQRIAVPTPASSLSVRCPKVAGASCLLTDGARAPLELNLHTVSGVRSADGSKAMLQGFGTDAERSGWGYQVWLYEAGKLRRIALPRAEMANNSIELAWFGELPELR